MFAKLKRLFRHSFVYTVGRIVEKGGAFFLIPLYISQLDITEYGILGLANTVYFVLVLLAGLVLPGAVARFYFDYCTDSERLRQYLGTVVMSWFSWNVSFALLLLALGPTLFGALLPQVPFFPYLLLTILMAFFGGFSGIPMALFQVRQQPGAVVFFSIASFALTASLTLLFVVRFKWGLAGSLLGTLAANGILVVPYTAIMLRSIRIRFHWPDLRQSLLFSLPLVPHLFAQWALNLSDRFFLARFTSLSEVGVYNLAAQLTMVQSMIAGAISTAWSPFYFAESSRPGGEKIIARFATYYVFVLSVLALMVSLFAKELVTILSSLGSARYIEAHRFIPPLSLGFLFLGLYYVVVNGFFYQKRTSSLFLYTLGSAAINVILNIITIPHYGAWAAAINTAISYGFLAFIVYIGVRKVHFIPFEIRRIGILLLTAVLLYLGGQHISTGRWQWDLACKMVVISAYPLMLLVLGFFEQDEKRKFAAWLCHLRNSVHIRLEGMR